MVIGPFGKRKFAYRTAMHRNDCTDRDQLTGASAQCSEPITNAMRVLYRVIPNDSNCSLLHILPARCIAKGFQQNLLHIILLNETRLRLPLVLGWKCSQLYKRNFIQLASNLCRDPDSYGRVQGIQYLLVLQKGEQFFCSDTIYRTKERVND